MHLQVEFSINDRVEIANLTWSSSGDYLLYIDDKNNLVEYHPTSKEHIKRNTITVDIPIRMYLSPNDEYLIFVGSNDSNHDRSADKYVMNMSNNEAWQISTPKLTSLPDSPWSLDGKRVLLGYGGVNCGDGVALYDIHERKVCYKRDINDFSNIIAWDKLSNEVVVSKKDGSVWKVKLYSKGETQISP